LHQGLVHDDIFSPVILNEENQIGETVEQLFSGERFRELRKELGFELIGRGGHKIMPKFKPALVISARRLPVGKAKCHLSRAGGRTDCSSCDPAAYDKSFDYSY
jgi:hypothetical protein